MAWHDVYKYLNAQYVNLKLPTSDVTFF